MSDDDFSDPYDEPSMDLFIETLTGTTFEMRVFPSDTILDIKKKIQRVEGIPVQHQNLLFRLEEVEDYSRLCDIGVVNGSTLKLVLAMRGGPISTRRLSSCDHHLIWKDLKELIEHTREELGDKLSAGAKVSVLVFKDGDVINLIRVIENDDGNYHPYGEKSSSSPSRHASHEDGHGVYNKMQEQNSMLAKLSELRKRMADVSLKRSFKNSKPVEGEEPSSVGCIGQKPSKETEEQLKDEKGGTADSGCRYRWLDQFRRDAVSLLKLHESQFGDDDEEEDEENDSDDLEETLQICDEDSIALKEKHRGKNSFYNILFQEPSLMPDKLAKLPKTKLLEDVPISTTFSKEARERSSFHMKPKESPLRNVKLKEKPSELDGNLPSVTKAKSVTEPVVEEKRVGGPVLSPIYNCFSSNSRSRGHKYDSKINLPDIACDLEISPPTTASSLAESIAIIEEDTENEDKEVLSPIGVPCAGTLSMSKVPTRNSVRLTPLLLQNTSDRPKSSPEAVNIEENAQEICDILAGDSAEGFRSSKLGLLKRWQNMDCSSEEVCGATPARNSLNFKERACEGSDFEVVNRNCYLPSLFPTSSGPIPSQQAPQKERVSDLYFGNRVNQEHISRSPLYRRCPHVPAESATASASDSAKSDSHKARFDGKLHGFASTWGGSGADLGAQKLDSNSKCDNMLNIEPISGTLYNILSGKKPNVESGFVEGKLELNPLRVRGEEEPSKWAKEIRSLYSDGEKGTNLGKIKVDAAKLENLPAIIEKKRMRCGFCNKRLNITNMYDCRCGGIFCGQHRYSEVHFCNYDYKTEGRKLLERQNPVIVADKLNKL